MSFSGWYNDLSIPDDLSFINGAHILEGEKQILQVVL